jgi:glutathione synthase/RimK-type ligase-like ATP-grasp enzyme
LSAILVTENVRRWPLRFEGAEIVSARDYLVGGTWAERRGLRVYNLCRTYGYQTLGYYVSLLAAARGHRPFPTVETLQDLRLSPVVRLVSEQLEELIQKSLARLQGKRFELSVYFGRNLAQRYETLARALHEQFPMPMMRASFERRGSEWHLSSVRPIATSEIPESHRPFLMKQAELHFGRPQRPSRARRTYRYDLAILTDPRAPDAPSDPKALRSFVRAAREVGIEAHLIDHDDASDIAEFDALFIRETTYVNHSTYRLARRATTEGLVVIDDPISILRCTNKVFLAELFERHAIPHPETVVAHEDTVEKIAATVGLPCVLKRPDSAFSQGVVRVDSEAELLARAGDFLRDSQLVIAQAYTPSEFDWRIGVLGGEPLYVCRYHMARGHWQIVAPRGRREAPLWTGRSRGARRCAHRGDPHRRARGAPDRRRTLRRRREGVRRALPGDGGQRQPQHRVRLRRRRDRRSPVPRGDELVPAPARRARNRERVWPQLSRARSGCSRPTASSSST